ncbi:protein lplB, partial [Cellulomonas bogoriensis 69B4 = DSM 16987]
MSLTREPSPAVDRGVTAEVDVDPPGAGTPSVTSGPARRRPWKTALRRDWPLYAMALVPVLFLLLFRYVPMLGNVIAFRRFRPGGSMFGEEWVGFAYIELFINDPTFWKVFANTAILGGLTLLFCFPLPIVLALALNEVRKTAFKRTIQSISYLPHF